MYGCDCDGVERQQLDIGGVEGKVIRDQLRVIKTIAGYRPATCPWRAFYEPIVQEVLAMRWAVEGGGLNSVLGPDPDYIVVEAHGVYHRALKSTLAEEERVIAKEQLAKIEAQRRAAKLHG
jgi:hypothetical protein